MCGTCEVTQVSGVKCLCGPNTGRDGGGGCVVCKSVCVHMCMCACASVCEFGRGCGWEGVRNI